MEQEKLNQLKLQAEQGDAEAQLLLGKYYCEENEECADIKQSVYWWTKASEQGNMKAMHNLGNCYFFIEEIQDLEKAVHWWTNAAEQGLSDSQFNLGQCYYDGDGVKQDSGKAVYWWTKAAEQGDAEAQFSLGICYINGVGVEQNVEKAEYWLSKAAEQGLNAAQEVLYVGEERLNIPFEEAERIFLEVLDKAIAEKKHKRCKEVTLNYVIAGHAMNLTVYREDYAKGDCFREKALFYFYVSAMENFNIAEWRNVLYKAMQCMRAFSSISPAEYIWYHHAARIGYQTNGDDIRGKRHLYSKFKQEAIIADEKYLIKLIKDCEAPSDENRSLLLTIFYYALIRSDWSEDDEFDWSRERHTLIEQALKEATTYYAESEECSLLQRALIYQCREIYYRKTRRAKLAEKANKRLFELLKALSSEGIDEDNFLENALQTIEEDVPENLLPPFISAVQNVFADMLCDEKEETEEVDENIDEEETISPDMLELCMEKANGGDDVSQYILGRCYYYGEGVEQDFNQAVLWWTKAANQGNADAMNLLGLAYRFGLGVEVDYAKSLSLLQEAADKDCASALMNLGVCYQEGWGVEVDIEEALRLYMMAAERGDVMALFNIGLYYHTEEDYEKAIYWYRQAVDKEDPLAMSNLGYCYENGLGVEVNLEEAARLYRASAELGHDCAQYNLAECFELGKGIGQDLEQAIHWYTHSAEQGYENAVKALERLKKG